MPPLRPPDDRMVATRTARNRFGFRLMSPKQRGQLARGMTWVVVLLHGAMLLTLAVTPTDPPPRCRLFELIWAWMHKPTFYPFAALLLAGPPCTIIAASLRGWHRLWLALSWAVFAAAVIALHGGRVEAMVRILWWQCVE
jgi:hypothetical protein